jgi:hypothetical protein
MALIRLRITRGQISRLMMWIKLLFLGRNMRRFLRFWGLLLLLLKGKGAYQTDFLSRNNILKYFFYVSKSQMLHCAGMAILTFGI